MNRYIINIVLSDGDKIEAKAVGKSREDAIERLQANKSFIEFVGSRKIEKVDISFLEKATPVNPEDYILQKSNDVYNLWICTDKRNNVVVRFCENQYNDTAEVVPLYDMQELPTGEIATIIRQIGEYIALYHPEIV